MELERADEHNFGSMLFNYLQTACKLDKAFIFIERSVLSIEKVNGLQVRNTSS
jgi:hypothetical protein